MIDKFGPRVISFHVKDMAADGIRPNCGNPEQRVLGQGAINFAPMLASAKNETKYYFAERDPVAIGGPTNFNPFNNTADSAVDAQGRPGADAEGGAATAAVRGRGHRRRRQPARDQRPQRR